MEIEPNFGLDYIVENSDYTSKLAKALDCNNVSVKKQVFELLSALCVYNADGYARALQALEQYKDFKLERYRLKFVVDELTIAENSVDYKTAILAFINCIIISTPQLKDRIHIRNEFIGLKLLPVLSDLRRCTTEYPDLGVQIDVFEEQRENDESQILDGPYGVDLSSHVDVFYAILRQVADTPQEIPFLSILQHLLRIDPKEAVSDIVWDTAETLVHRATLLESRQDASRILRSPSIQNRLCCHGHRSVPDTVCGSRKQSLNIPTSPISQNNSAPPPPPPPPSFVLGPPPPPLPPLCKHLENMGAPPRPPPLFPENGKSVSTASEMVDVSNLKLPQQETPIPKAKMKTINWNKIPNNKVIGNHNIWSLVARSHEHSPMPDLDWSEMEGLFCQQIASSAQPNQSSPKLGRDSSEFSERRRKETSEITLLDGKRSLNINIFLKQFRCSNEDIIQIIREGGHDDIGTEKLRGLLKMLPEVDELEMLRSFDGDKRKLGNAEKFLLQLIEIPNYKLRIESMLLKEEFASNMGYLEPSINAMIVAGEDLMTKKSLQELLYMVICAGNFLNSGGYAGNAAGVKLSALQKLTDIRANKPGMNLIHYVAMQVEKKRPDLKNFTEELALLEDATKTSVEQLENETNALDLRIKKIKKQIELPSTEIEIKEQTKDFLRMAETEIIALQEDLIELESVRKSLADFFCEDAATFKIEECFKIFHGFCVKFKQAIVENERRKIQEEEAMARRRQREEQLAVKKKFAGNTLRPPEADCAAIMDSLLNDIQQSGTLKRLSDKDHRSRKISANGMAEDNSSITGSPIVMRRRLGSYSGDVVIVGNNAEENYSPDVTPTGSLRRRRSRVPSEEDESLMDFLRSSSGQENARERKSWGSLDRSWARRARGGGKKRPDLLTADFSSDRERPSSPAPSPVVETKSLLPTPEAEEVKPKAWRQKIEAWLQENEKEEKQNEDLCRKAQKLQNSRRTLEHDAEISVDGGNKLCNKNSSSESYKRVYPDWTPTDVVGAMKVIADIQQTEGKDKSDWRKSSFNSSGTHGDYETDGRRLRRMRSRGSADASPPLEAIEEEEKRKGLIESLSKSAENSDSVVVYFRKPTDETDGGHGPLKTRMSPLASRKKFLSPDMKDEQMLPPFSPRRNRKTYDPDSVDRDMDPSDCVLTPPANRKVFQRSEGEPSAVDRKANGDLKERKHKDDEEPLGDGQFDRFSSARRTRRYRKSTDDDGSKLDAAGGAIIAEKQILRPTTLQVNSCPIIVAEPQDKDSRLKRWQSKIKYKDLEDESKDEDQEKDSAVLKTKPEPVIIEDTIFSKKPITGNRIPIYRPEIIRGDRLYSTLPHSFRAKSQDIQNGISKIPSRNESYGSGRCNSNIRNHSAGNGGQSLTPSPKIRSEHDLNDEGFEESQSLISDSPSHTTSSGYNIDIEGNEYQKSINFNRADSSESADTTSSSSNISKPLKLTSHPVDSTKPSVKRYPSLIRVPSNIEKKTVTVIPTLNNQNLSRTNSLRLGAAGYKNGQQQLLLKKSDTYIAERKPNTPCSKIDTRCTGGGLKKQDMTPKVQPPNHSQLPRKSIERSISKNSLKSSKSSLNSSTSIGTVKAIKSSPNSKFDKSVKKPFTPVQPKSRTVNIGSRNETPTAVYKSKMTSPSLTTSFKENSEDAVDKNNHCDINRSSIASYLKPTAASSAKDLTERKSKPFFPKF